MARAILAVCPAWGPSEGAPHVLAARHAERLAALADRVAPIDGAVVASDGELVLVVVPRPDDAVNVALDWRERFPDAVIGLACGDDPSDPDAGRARRLAWRGPPGVRCTAAFLTALGTPPIGVGLYRTPHDLEHRFGFDAHDLSDHRP